MRWRPGRPSDVGVCAKFDPASVRWRPDGLPGGVPTLGRPEALGASVGGLTSVSWRSSSQEAAVGDAQSWSWASGVGPDSRGGAGLNLRHVVEMPIARALADGLPQRRSVAG